MSRILLVCVFSIILMSSITSSIQKVLADETDIARVQFTNSCRPEVQTEFNQGITLLHSFEYTETTRIFNEIIKKDPTCAIARWGAAMSIWHPLWAPPSSQQLIAGANLLAKTDVLEKTPREQAFIDAAKAFFSSTDRSTHRERAKAHELGMEQLYRNNLDDPEAVIFYALSLLATADPRDKSYANQFKSAGLLNWIKASEPKHPGIFHYLIHSYDYPGLAHLALEAALDYANAAPDSAHAQHMPSHIFTRLGLWDRSLASNHDSTQSAADYTLTARLPGHYDEGLHSTDYLMYALLQTARDDEAKELLVKLKGIKRTDTENFKVAYTYAASPARLELERRNWANASRLELIRENDFPWEDFGWAQSIHFFARGIGSARNGQTQKAREEWAAIKSIWDELPETTLPYWREEVQVEMDMVMAWIMFKEGKTEEAIQLAAAAATREDAVDKHPVTPGEVLPARELYADMLMEAGDFVSALKEYRAVLTSSPNRLNALLGAANAAKEASNVLVARKYCQVVQSQLRSGNQNRLGLMSACG